MNRTFVSTNIQANSGPVYLDCSATAPMEPAVREAVVRWTTEEVGNAGSRTHEFGLRAKRAVNEARGQVANVVGSTADDVVFTSGATESNNLALLGLAAHAEKAGRRHIVSTAIEHKAVLEPLEALVRRGFEVTLLSPDASGAIDPEAVRSALRPDTLIVSVMHVNNETGINQPLSDIASVLKEHEAYFHVDAAQGFGKDIVGLRDPRIDLISVSSHKIHGPLGVGALVQRKRGFSRPPLTPLVYGGGQERGLRPGTLPTPLLVGFGLAAKIALTDVDTRRRRCEQMRVSALAALEPAGALVNGDPKRAMPHVLNFSVPGIDSEALILALKDVAAISNGSACTSQSYQPSHVLRAMGLGEEAIAGAVRLSWCHMTEFVDWPEIARRIESFR